MQVIPATRFAALVTNVLLLEGSVCFKTDGKRTFRAIKNPCRCYSSKSWLQPLLRSLSFECFWYLRYFSGAFEPARVTREVQAAQFLSWNGHFLVVIGGGREPQRSSLGSIVLDATTFPSSIGNRSM